MKMGSSSEDSSRKRTPTMNGSEIMRPEPQNSSSEEKKLASTRLSDCNSAKGSADVGAVVSKAKKAAASLWMMLHAQHCQAGTYHCKYKGCAQAKLVLFHIKECKAKASEECPMQYQGCAQTRKLLAHYDQCREIRARQSRQKPTSRGSARQEQQQHTCLVCSLVARHARNVLDGGKSPAVANGKGRRVISSFSLTKAKICPDSTTSVIIPANLINSWSEKAMPPPATRRPQNVRSISKDQEESNFSSSLPSSSELMSHDIKAVAAATSTQGGTVHQSMLGKSLDSTSTYMNKMDALLKATQEVDENQVVRHHQRRSRAESYDASSAKPRLQQPVHLPHDFVGEGRNDPTLEALLTSEGDRMGNQESPGLFNGRTRSASLGVLLEVSRCATILEEGRCEEASDAGMEQPFPMEDDLD